MSTNNTILSLSRQTALDFMVGDHYLAIAIDSFINDRKSRNRSSNTIRFYRDNLNAFEKYSNSQSVTSIQNIDPNFLRTYILSISQERNPGEFIVSTVRYVHSSFGLKRMI